MDLWRIYRMVNLKEIDARLSEKIQTAMKNRHWSSRTLSEEIARAGGRVAYATIDNIAKNPTKSELTKLYWVLRVLNLSLGEAFDFTVEHTDDRAHRMLAAALRLDPADRAHVMDVLQYVLAKGAGKENLARRA